MSSVSNPYDYRDDVREQREYEREQFRTSRFDVVTSLLMALMAFLGLFVFMLFIMWLSTFDYSTPMIEPIIETPAGRGENAPGEERDFDEPSDEEIEELLEPTLVETISVITEAVQSVAVANASSKKSRGDSRPPGPEGEGDDIVPRFMRWQLEFQAKDVKGYAKQLDFYKIELGALGGGKKGVEIANNLSGSPKKRLITDTKSEKRLYFMFKRPTPLQKFDTQLLSKAGATVGAGRTILKFIPPELENQLARIELDYAKDKGHDTVKEIAKTIFKSVSDNGKYRFEITSQRYRKPRW